MSNQQDKTQKMFSNWGTNIAKGIVRTKQLAVQKIAKAPETEVDPLIKPHLTKYKQTKYETIDITNCFSELLKSKQEQLKYSTHLAFVFNKYKESNDNDDKFGQLCIQKAKKITSLRKIEEQFINDINTSLIPSFEKFRDINIENTGKIKLKWKTIKNEYDFRLNEYNKVNNKTNKDNNKIKLNKEKLGYKKRELDDIQKIFKDSMIELEKYKCNVLQGVLGRYMDDYKIYASNIDKALKGEKVVLKKKKVVNGGNKENVGGNKVGAGKLVVNGRVSNKQIPNKGVSNKQLPSKPLPSNVVSKPNNDNLVNYPKKVDNDIKSNEIENEFPIEIEDESSSEYIDKHELMMKEEELREKERLAKKKNIPYWQTDEYKNEQNKLQQSLNGKSYKTEYQVDNNISEIPDEFKHQKRITVDMSKAKLSANIDGLNYEPGNL